LLTSSFSHGCIDGYSRLIIYLSVTNNKCASTIRALFEEGARQHGLPSRVRADEGKENRGVELFILEMRGKGRFLTGRCV
jgi:hypothetical protein